MDLIVPRREGSYCPPGDFVHREYLRRLVCAVFAFFLAMGAGMIHAEDATVSSATALHAKYAELSGKLENSPFQKPLFLESGEVSGELKGSMYALLRHPFPTVQAELKEPEHWCDILILHLNTKYCRASAGSAGTVLKVNIGRKSDQPIEKSYRVEFAYRVIEAGPEHLAVVLNADKRAVKQVLINLLSNAVKFTPENGTVTLSSKPWHDGVEFVVSDTGIGIDQKDMHVALAPFGQIDSQFTRKYEGTGLGLPIVKGIVELHGGTLEIKSEPSQGTSVIVRFPNHPPEPPMAEILALPRKQAVAGGH